MFSLEGNAGIDFLSGCHPGRLRLKISLDRNTTGLRHAVPVVAHHSAEGSGSELRRKKVCSAGTTIRNMIGPISMPPTTTVASSVDLAADPRRDGCRQQPDASRQRHHQNCPHLLFNRTQHGFGRAQAPPAGNLIVTVDDEYAAHHRHAEQETKPIAAEMLKSRLETYSPRIPPDTANEIPIRAIRLSRNELNRP